MWAQQKIIQLMQVRPSNSFLAFTFMLIRDQIPNSLGRAAHELIELNNRLVAGNSHVMRNEVAQRAHNVHLAMVTQG